jgi:hypothetical protein
MRQGVAPFVWRQVTTWPSWLQSVATLLIGLMGLDLLRMLARRLDAATNGESPPPADAVPRLVAATGERAAYQSLLAQLDAAESEIDEKTYLDVAADLPRWQERLRTLKQAIRGGDLSDAERELLLKRAATLRFEIHSSLQSAPKPPSKPRRPTADTPPLTTPEPAPPAE